MKYVKTFETYNQEIIQEKTGYKKTYYQQDNIGKAKYTISYHDGVDTHKDGSPFFGIRTFKNKEKMNKFVDELKKKGYIESLNPIKESKTEYKSIKKEADFFKLAGEIDKKYFPDVKYYRDDKDDTAVHYAIEIFNNGISGYDTLINKLAKHCKDTKENIHNIVKKHIEDFGDYEYEVK